MFESYNTKDFGLKLKEIRLSLGLTQSDVSHNTGINTDTLRKIENGYSLPRYDTLSHLSNLYKRDIHKLFVSYQTKNLLYEFYKTLDQLIMYGRFDEIKKLHQSFLHSLNESSELMLVDNIVLEQIDLYILGVSQRYKNNSKAALETIGEGLLLTNSHFSFEIFEEFKYSTFEIRLLIVAAACLGDLKSFKLSNRISEFVIKNLNFDLHSEKSDDIFYIKSLCNISNNYHQMSIDSRALEFAQRAINLSLEKGHLDMLHFLFLREAVAKMHLQDSSYIESFKKCLYVIKITGEVDHLEHMKKIINEKYNLIFDI